MKRRQQLIQLLASAAATLVGLFALIYGEKLNLPYLQASGFVFFFITLITVNRFLSLLSVFFLFLGVYYLQVDIQSLQASRVLFFALFFILLINSNSNRSIFLSAVALWFVYLSAHLLPVESVNVFVVSVSPAPDTKTLEIMLVELFLISCFGLFPSFRFRKNNVQKMCLEKFIIHTAALPVTVISLFVFYMSDFKKITLTPASSASGTLLLGLAVTFIVIRFISKKTSNEFRNVISHLEICATPDSSFLAFSKKQPIPLLEYFTMAKTFKRRAEAITRARRKATKSKLELSSLKRAYSEQKVLNEKLELLAENSKTTFVSVNKGGFIAFAGDTFYQKLNLEKPKEMQIHYVDLLKGIDAFQIYLRYALEWSLDNFEKLSNGAECPFDSASIDGKKINIYFKSIEKEKSNVEESLVLVYLRESAVASESEHRAE